MPKGKAVHILSDVWGDQAHCAHCGPVDVQWRTYKGRKVPRCGAARRAEPGRNRWHLLRPAPEPGPTQDPLPYGDPPSGVCPACADPAPQGEALCGACARMLGVHGADPGALRAHATRLRGLATYVDAVHVRRPAVHGTG